MNIIWSFIFNISILSTAFAIAVKFTKPYEEQTEVYSTVVVDKTDWTTSHDQTIFKDYLTKSSIDLQTSVYGKKKNYDLHEPITEISKEMEPSTQSNDNVLNLDSTTCTEATPTHDVVQIQKKENFGNIPSGKNQQPTISEYNNVKGKLKSSLFDKLKINIAREKRQVQNKPTNHFPVYRDSQILNSNHQKLNYYAQYKNAQQKITPAYYKLQAITRIPDKTIRNTNPPSSGYAYPVDSYLAYSNINNVNNGYSAIYNSNRRQFQPSRRVVPTRRTTTRPTTKQRKKFRPMPVFA